MLGYFHLSKQQVQVLAVTWSAAFTEQLIRIPYACWGTARHYVFIYTYLRILEYKRGDERLLTAGLLEFERGLAMFSK